MVKLDYIEVGNQKSKKLIVFLQGWPDNHQMWQWINWREDLSEYRIVFIDFPNSNGNVTHKWGVDFPQITEGIKQVVDKIPNVQTKLLVAHDWGCIYGYLVDQKYPNYFDQMIAMDVPAMAEIQTLRALLFVLAYQLYLIIAFIIGGKIGAWMTQKMVSFMKYNPPYRKNITSYQNYPYLYFHKNRIVSIFNKQKALFKKGYRPSMPLVYLYGKLKPFQFHGGKWTKWIQDNKQRGCQIHGIQDYHWFMKKFPKFITDLIVRRLK